MGLAEQRHALAARCDKVSEVSVVPTPNFTDHDALLLSISRSAPLATSLTWRLNVSLLEDKDYQKLVREALVFAFMDPVTAPTELSSPQRLHHAPPVGISKRSHWLQT